MFLVSRFLESGGSIIKQERTGLGAKLLTKDSELETMSGHGIRVDTGDKARNTFTYIHTGTSIVPYYYWT